jgi:hypothetical protein
VSLKPSVLVPETRTRFAKYEPGLLRRQLAAFGVDSAENEGKMAENVNVEQPAKTHDAACATSFHPGRPGARTCLRARTNSENITENGRVGIAKLNRAKPCWRAGPFVSDECANSSTDPNKKPGANPKQ